MADYVFQVPAILNYAGGLFKPDDRGRYNADLLWDKTDPRMKEELTRFEEYMHGVYRSGFQPSGKDKTIPFAGLDENAADWAKLVPLPLKDGDKTEFTAGSAHAGQTRADVYPEYKGRVYMKVRSSYNLLTGMDASGNPVGSIAMADRTASGPVNQRAFYSGCLVQAKIWVTPYRYQQTVGYTARLVALVKVGDAEPIGGARASDDPFSGMDMGAGEDVTPFADMGI